MKAFVLMATFAGVFGTDLSYEEEGTGSPVLLLHGLSVDTQQNWRAPGIWSALVDAGHRVIGFDARGHGRSGKPHDPAAYEEDAMVKDVAACFDQLGLTGVDLAGYSMGASTALQFAARDGRVRRLVLGGIGGDPQQWGAEDGRSAMRSRWLAGVEADDPAALEKPGGARCPPRLRGSWQRPRGNGGPPAREPPTPLAGHGVGGRGHPHAGRVR